MWQVLTTSPNIDNAYIQLLAEFDVDEEWLRLDFPKLFGQLVEKGLIQIHSTNAA